MSAGAPLDPPYVLTKGPRTYYVATDGSAWRVRDTLWEQRRHREMTLGSPDATARLFTNPDGRRRVYEFAGDEPRGFSERELDRQLRMAKVDARALSPDPETTLPGRSELR